MGENEAIGHPLSSPFLPRLSLSPECEGIQKGPPECDAVKVCGWTAGGEKEDIGQSLLCLFFLVSHSPQRNGWIHRSPPECDIVKVYSWSVESEKEDRTHTLSPSASQALLSAAIPLPFSHLSRIRRGPRSDHRSKNSGDTWADITIRTAAVTWARRGGRGRVKGRPWYCPAPALETAASTASLTASATCTHPRIPPRCTPLDLSLP